MKCFFFLVVIMLITNSCADVSDEPVINSVLKDNIIVLKEKIQSSKHERYFHYSYSQCNKGTGFCFNYDYDSTVVRIQDSKRVVKTVKDASYSISLLLGSGRDTLYYDRQMNNIEEKRYNEHRSYIFDDSIKICFDDSKYTLLKYKRVDKDLRWDEDYFISPDFGTLYVHYYYFNSTLELVKHPEITNRDLYKIMKEIRNHVSKNISTHESPAAYSKVK